MKRIVFCFLSLFLFQLSCYSNDENEAFTQLQNEDSADISTIASYPEITRNAVFEACTQPQGIVNIANLQKASQTEFRNAIASYTKEQQQKIWNLTRYSGLISKLVSAGQLSKSAIEDILKDYPAEVQETGRDYTLHHFELLKTMNGLEIRFTLLFNESIKTYSSFTQASFRELLNTPELISLLNSNMRMAVNLGVIHQNNPTYVKQRFEALNLEQAQQKARELEEWKQKMKDEPEAERELQDAAKEYATDNGYNENDYSETDPVIIYRYVYTPYPYWCGYPTWYEYEWWYPYPYWYHWGFCYWHGSIVWHSPPSWFFVHWHFHHYPHFHRYPHITNAYFDYYHGHHRQQVRSSETIERWYVDNNDLLPNDFIPNDKNRIEVIRNLGKFEDDYHKQNATGTGTLNKHEFLNKNRDKYPALKPTLPVESKPVDNKYSNGKERPVLPANEKPVYKPVPQNPTPKPITPKPEPPHQIKPDIQPAPTYQPRQNVQPKPNNKPMPTPGPKQNVQPPVHYQPKPNIQPRPQVQPIPRQNSPTPKNEAPRNRRL